MARIPVDERPALAQWLIRARSAMGDGYTVDRFLSDLRSASGHAPHRSTYAGWESGSVTPEPASLAPIVAFWRSRGVAGPQHDASVPPPDLASALMALARELEASRLERREMAQRVADLETALASMAPGSSRPAATRAARPTPAAPVG